MEISIELPKEIYDKYLKFVCYERTYNYILNFHMNDLKTDNLFIDRIFGYNFDEVSPEPLIREENMLSQVFKSFGHNIEVIKNDFLDVLLFELENGKFVQIAMEMTNAQNEKYYTSVLLEGTSNNNILFTKVSETENKVRFNISVDELIQRVMFVDKKTSLEIIDIKAMKSGYDQVKYSILGKNIEKLNGLEQYICSQSELFNNSKDGLEILDDKIQQLRFSKHLLNKLYPCYFYLNFQSNEFQNEELKNIANELHVNLEKLEKICSIVLGTRKEKMLINYFETLELIKENIDTACRHLEKYE